MSQCYANPDPTFQPSYRLINAVSRAFPASVTTTFDHDYASGTIVRFKIPIACGMRQLDGMTGVITVTGATTLTVDVDTTMFDTFVLPAVPVPPWADTCALIIPIGEINSNLDEATRNVLP